MSGGNCLLIKNGKWTNKAIANGHIAHARNKTLQDKEHDGYINIFSFDPGLNETLSPVSSVPQRVRPCNFNGKPQYANISYIFTNTSVYRGETITLPACIVGYDFGTTVGMICARSFYSDFLSKQDKSQLVANWRWKMYSFQLYSLFKTWLAMNFYCYKHHASLPVTGYLSYESTEYNFLSYENGHI